MERIMTEKEVADLNRMRAMLKQDAPADHQKVFDEYREAEYAGTAPNFAELRTARDEAEANVKTLSAALDEKRAETSRLIEEIEEKFRANNAELIELADRAVEIHAKAEAALRQAIIDEHKRTGNKMIDKDLKLSVRVNRKVLIRDNVAALAWAKANAPLLVREVLDEKSFARIVETLPDLPAFVEEVKTPVAVIGNK